MQVCPNLFWEQLLAGDPTAYWEGMKPYRHAAPVVAPLLSPASVAVLLLEHTGGPGTASNAALLQDFANS